MFAKLLCVIGMGGCAWACATAPNSAAFAGAWLTLALGVALWRLLALIDNLDQDRAH